MRPQSVVIALISVIVAAAVVIGAVVTVGTATKKPTPPTGTAGISVEILNFAFHAQNLVISVNTTVEWYNNDSMAHTVTSAPGTPLAFDSGILNPGSTFTYKFTVPGTYPYYCKIHPFMLGNVTVTP